MPRANHAIPENIRGVRVMVKARHCPARTFAPPPAVRTGLCGRGSFPFFITEFEPVVRVSLVRLTEKKVIVGDLVGAA